MVWLNPTYQTPSFGPSAIRAYHQTKVRFDASVREVDGHRIVVIFLHVVDPGSPMDLLCRNRLQKQRPQIFSVDFGPVCKTICHAEGEEDVAFRVGHLGSRIVPSDLFEFIDHAGFE